MSAQQSLISGTVYGVILNDRGSLDRLGAALEDAPYKGAPKAPVLYIKPANTHLASGSTVCLQAGENQVEVGATVGIVLGAAASRVKPADAAALIAGYRLVADLSLPHASYYRPAIREKCFDGACPMGELVPAGSVAEVRNLAITVEVDGKVVATRTFADLVRDVPQLLADVSEFMTLQPGDMLLVGVRYQAEQAARGQAVRLSAAGLGELTFNLAV